VHDAGVMPERLGRFLSARDGTRTAVVRRYEAMVGGYSRVMARAEVAWSDGSVEMVVLRGDPPAGKAMIETDRDVEHALLHALSSRGSVAMPAVRAYDSSGAELGTKCIVLDHVDGQSLQALLNATPIEQHGEHALDLVDTLDRGHAESVPFLRYVASWLDAHRPPPLPLRLVHSDFQAANIMVERGGRHLMIDWELAHVGDPREDLGYYNVYSSASGPNLFARDPEAFLARYRERTGFDEQAVNLTTMAYFSSLAAITVYAQVLQGAGALARGTNAGLLTTYTMNALTIGHSNFLAGCTAPQPTAVE
jgi:aminoglycoside phosphotransferase (APT) family kinase protein